MSTARQVPPEQVMFYVGNPLVRWKYATAGRALWGQDLASFLQYCAAYVIQNHPDLEAVRGKIRRAEERLARKRREVPA